MVWSYEEYEEYIYEDYSESIDKEKISRCEALARMSEGYYVMERESETDKAIIAVMFSEIVITHLKVLNTYKNYMENMLKELDFRIVRQENRLTEEQCQELMARKERVLPKLQAMPLTYYSRVCWYYDEITEEVQKFIQQLPIEQHPAIVSAVLQRFQRDCNNTNSEKFMVYTALADQLWERGWTAVEGVEAVKQQLQAFDPTQVAQEQLTEEEQKQLAVRIQQILAKLP